MKVVGTRSGQSANNSNFQEIVGGKEGNKKKKNLCFFLSNVTQHNPVSLRMTEELTVWDMLIKSST